VQNEQHGNEMGKVTLICQYCGKKKTLYDTPNIKLKNL